VSRPFAAPLLWAALLLTIAGVSVAAFEVTDPETPSLLAGGALLVALVGAFIASRRHGPPDAGDRTARVIPDTSVPTVLVAVSLAALAVGAELGVWLVLIAAGMLLVGIFAMVRESRASRELADLALEPEARAGERTGGGEGRGPRFDLPGEH
jgi:hypothetical protein